MSAIDEVEEGLRQSPRRWLVTGVAGFIGSNLLERLLLLEQQVVGLDNFATGHRANLDEVLALVGPKRAQRFTLIEGDIREPADCRRACEGVELVLHQAALGSVPRSLNDPLLTHQVNVNGSLNVLLAARDAKVRRLVYATSSSTYGDSPALPKVEHELGKPLSPYAATKRINELYAGVFSDAFGLETIGLRYFNVFGKRQDPAGPYAAVIPRWVDALLHHSACVIHGDGETSRDFCYVENVVQANLLSALAPAASPAVNQVYNVAVGARTTLTELFRLIQAQLTRIEPSASRQAAEREPFRKGDIRHSHADISKAMRLLGYHPRFSVEAGLERTMPWYVERSARHG